ncbi:MAG TPA: DNA polymerase III subunit delta [Candidatus Microsaccharimonas sp.]|jgi:DNA polymerase III delta subunit
MITWFTGENTFDIQQAVKTATDRFDGTAERIDGTTLELKNIPDLLMGGTLFAEKRLVIIKDLSQNSNVWEKLPEWIDRISEDIDVILIDGKPDKRTTGYKEVKKRVVLKEFPVWGERDQALAEAWVLKHADSLGLSLDKKLAHHIVGRVGLDQWRLANSLEKISLLAIVTPETINDIIEPNASENVFQLFELALDSRRDAIHDMIRTLELVEDPYKLFALLSSQAFQLAAVASAGPQDNPAKEFGIHPYVAGKLSRHGNRLGARGAARILTAFAQTDADMKRSRGEPWLLIERTLLSISQ